MDEVLQILPKFLAAHDPTAPLAPWRGATFHPVEEKLGQVLLQGAALSPWPRDFSGVQKCSEQCCRFHRSGCGTVKGGSAGVTPWMIPLPVSSTELTFTSFGIFFCCFFPPLLQNV